MAKGQSAQQACRKLRVAEQTCYRWRKEYGGLLRVPEILTTSIPETLAT